MARLRALTEKALPVVLDMVEVGEHMMVSSAEAF